MTCCAPCRRQPTPPTTTNCTRRRLSVAGSSSGRSSGGLFGVFAALGGHPLARVAFELVDLVVQLCGRDRVELRVQVGFVVGLAIGAGGDVLAEFAEGRKRVDELAWRAGEPIFRLWGRCAGGSPSEVRPGPAGY